MTEKIFNCLYCGLTKPVSEESLEHSIPQFMGGNIAPIRFELKNVCTKCNNRLGLFVDASYAKSWLITNALSEAAQTLCANVTDPGLPLRCVGHAKIPGLQVPEGHVAEYWLGPSGESTVWVRPHDDRMDSYSGGNPIDTKKKPSIAYFFPTSDNAVKFALGIKSFNRTFAKRNVRKILCAEVSDSAGNQIKPSALEFDASIAEDIANRAAILAAIQSGNVPATIAFNLKFDLRFMCKLALGIGYSLFRDDYLNDAMSIEARKGLWPKQDEPISTLKGASTLHIDGANLAQIAGYPGAVAIMVMRVGASWILKVSIDQKLPFVISLGSKSMTSPCVNSEEGYSLLLFPYLDKSIELTTATLIAHRIGASKHAELEKIDEKIRLASLFNVQISSLDIS